jgi:hypothetical protein
MKRTIVALLSAALGMTVVMAGIAQDLTIAELSDAPGVDGTVADGEYPSSVEFSGLSLHAGERDGSLFVAVVGETAGWVAVGFNSRRMDGAHIIIAYDAGDSQSIQEHSGRGHRHQQTQEGIAIQSAVLESDGVTVLEVEVPLNDVRDGSSQNIDLITGYGAQDNVTQYHTFRTAVQAVLE